MQRGRIYEACGKFYVQYRVNGKQVSKFLCEKSPAYHSKKCKAVRLLADEHMLGINKEAVAVAAPMTNMRVSDFWEQRFLPYCQELTADGRPRLKPSTVYGWKQIWSQHLANHFGEATLRDYRADQGTVFLDGLTASHSQQTLRHIKTLAGLIFKRAVAERRVNTNPWRDVVMPKSAIKPRGTPCYRWDEAKAVIQALEGHPECQLIIALVCFLGLRPNEVVAMRWEDQDGDWLHIRRGFVKGRLDVPKTYSSQDKVPLFPEIRRQLEQYRAGKTKGWMFPGNGALLEDRIVDPSMKHLAGPAPADLHNLTARVIKPILKAQGLQWKPLKAGRTGACTEIVERTGRVDLAQRMLRHDDQTTTLRFYKKQLSDRAALAGIRRLELPLGEPQ